MPTAQKGDLFEHFRFIMSIKIILLNMSLTIVFHVVIECSCRTEISDINKSTVLLVSVNRSDLSLRSNADAILSVAYGGCYLLSGVLFYHLISNFEYLKGQNTCFYL